MPKLYTDLAIKRLLKRTTVISDGCWLWCGAVDVAGYGKINRGGKAFQMLYAHRVSYEWFVRKLLPGETIDHLCRIKNCVNPEHLEAVSLKENILRSDSFTARNARKTGCPYDHGPYDGTYPNGWWYCKQCKNIKEKKRRANNKQKKAS